MHGSYSIEHVEVSHSDFLQVGQIDWFSTLGDEIASTECIIMLGKCFFHVFECKCVFINYTS